MPAVYSPPAVPPVSTLIASIIDSVDRLFFVSHSLGNPSTHEQRLTQVAFLDSMALYPLCLQDGCFLVKFYTLHYDNVWFNAINQRYWLQYHCLGDYATPTSSTQTHLIHPSDTFKTHATKQKLIPFWRWWNLTCFNTYIHGLFNFAIVNGCKTRTHISQANWDVLSHHKLQFMNLVPLFDLPSYSIHADQGVHTMTCNPSHVAALCAMSNLSGNCNCLHP